MSTSLLTELLVVVISVDNSTPTAYVGKTATVKVVNASQIQGLTAVGDNDAVGTVALASDTITITGVKAGTFNITINGTNASAPLVIKATIKDLITIAVDNASPSVNVGENTTINITNFAEITNPAVVVADTETATAELSKTLVAGAITITGVKAGSTNLTITGDNANALEVPITVNAGKEQLSSIIETEALGEIANNQEATIQTAVLAKNPKAKAGDFTIGGITNTTATLTGAGNYEGTVGVSFTIAPPPKIDITTDKDQVVVEVGKTDTIVVSNWSAITNPKVASSNNTIASLTSNNGTITVNGVSQGTAVCEITGDNANKKSVNITVNNPPKIDIELSKNTSTVVINATDTITITNNSALTNPKVVVAQTNIATATLQTGTITIAGVSAGQTTATVSADNGNNAVINITVNKIELSTVLTETALGELANNEEATILNAVVAKNATLKTSDITASDITETGANITASSSSNYTGTVATTFTIQAPPEKAKPKNTRKKAIA